MTQDDLIERISRGANLSKAATRDVLRVLTESVTYYLTRNEEVTLTGLAKFTVIEKPARTGRNPATGEAIAIAAHSAVKIKPLKALRDAVTT